VRDGRYSRAQAHDAGERQGTQSTASYGHSRYRERATYVHDLGRCELPDDRLGSSNVPGCEARSREIHGSLAARRGEAKKRFCCVTTRELNLSVLNDLRLRLHSLAAFFLGLGVLGSDVSILATFELAGDRLPAPHLSQAFGILPITLVPAPRLILAPTSFAQT
jgi:hypothetical protein